jgi:hypothetical protein
MSDSNSKVTPVTPGSVSRIQGVNVNSGVSLSREESDKSVLSENRRTIIEDVMIELGYPVISLYITQPQINQMIDFAVRKCASKATPKFLATFYARGCVDVSGYDMEAVSAVYQGDITSTSGSGGEGGCSACGSDGFMGCNICEKLCTYRGYSMGILKGDWNNEMYDMLAWQNARSQLNSLTLYDWYLDYTGQKLYLDNYSGVITVEYTKSHITAEDLNHDTTWYSWVRDYTLALCKVIEGRIRNKFKVASAPFEVEADELIQEGNNDKQELEQQLNENIGFYMILRS